MTEPKPYQISTTCYKIFPKPGEIYRRFSQYGAVWKRTVSHRILYRSDLENEKETISAHSTRIATLHTLKEQEIAITRKDIMKITGLKEAYSDFFDRQIEVLKLIGIIVEENNMLRYNHPAKS